MIRCGETELSVDLLNEQVSIYGKNSEAGLEAIKALKKVNRRIKRSENRKSAKITYLQNVTQRANLLHFGDKFSEGEVGFYGTNDVMKNEPLRLTKEALVENFAMHEFTPENPLKLKAFSIPSRQEKLYYSLEGIGEHGVLNPASDSVTMLTLIDGVPSIGKNVISELLVSNREYFKVGFNLTGENQMTHNRFDAYLKKGYGEVNSLVNENVIN